MPTGEQPAITVDTNTSFRWPILVALLGVAAMGAVGLARAQDAGVAVKEHEKSIQALQVDSAENKADHRAIRDLLIEIKADLKDVKAELAKKK